MSGDQREIEKVESAAGRARVACHMNGDDAPMPGRRPDADPPDGARTLP